MAAGCSGRLGNVSKELARVFRKRSINTHVGAKVDKVEKTKDAVALTITTNSNTTGVITNPDPFPLTSRSPRRGLTRCFSSLFKTAGAPRAPALTTVRD